MSVLNRIPLFLPELVILDTVNAILYVLRSDYVNKVSIGRERESLLALMLAGQTMGLNAIDIYKEAVKIFVTTPESQRHFDCKLNFDKNASKAPQLFITQGDETQRNTSIGIGEGDQDELIFSRNTESDQFRPQYSRRYETSQYLVIVCENRLEMQIIYNVIKAMLVASMSHFALKGLSNLKLNGKSLEMRVDIPDTIFQKAIVFNFEYEQVVPTIVAENVFRQIKLYWQMNGATIRSGPIVVENTDDLINSSSG